MSKIGRVSVRIFASPNFAKLEITFAFVNRGVVRRTLANVANNYLFFGVCQKKCKPKFAKFCQSLPKMTKNFVNVW